MTMNIRYKLTEQDLTTYNDTKWVLNEWKETDGFGKLCTGGWLHCYSDPLLAILLNPAHANITNPKLFKCEVEGKCLTDHGLKEGWTRMRIIEEVPFPQLSEINKIAFGILCALEVNNDEEFVKWAKNWLENKDRSKESAYDVSSTVYYGYYAAKIKSDNYAAKIKTCCYYAVTAVCYPFSSYRYSAAVISSKTAKANNTNLIKLAEKAMEIK